MCQASMHQGGSLKSVKVPTGRTYGNKIRSIETFAGSESAIDFKGFRALHSIVLNINDRLLGSDVQT